MTTDPTPYDPGTLSIISFEVTHPQGFGGHEFGYEQSTDLFRCEFCDGYEISLRDRETGEIGQCPGPKNADEGVTR